MTSQTYGLVNPRNMASSLVANVGEEKDTIDVKSDGSLRKALGVRDGEDIPLDKLKKAANSSDKALAKKAQFALNARGWKHKGEAVSNAHRMDFSSTLTDEGFDQLVAFLKGRGFEFTVPAVHVLEVDKNDRTVILDIAQDIADGIDPEPAFEARTRPEPDDFTKNSQGKRMAMNSTDGKDGKKPWKGANARKNQQREATAVDSSAVLSNLKNSISRFSNADEARGFVEANKAVSKMTALTDGNQFVVAFDEDVADLKKIGFKNVSQLSESALTQYRKPAQTESGDDAPMKGGKGYLVYSNDPRDGDEGAVMLGKFQALSGETLGAFKARVQKSQGSHNLFVFTEPVGYDDAGAKAVGEAMNEDELDAVAALMGADVGGSDGVGVDSGDHDEVEYKEIPLEVFENNDFTDWVKALQKAHEGKKLTVCHEGDRAVAYLNDYAALDVKTDPIGEFEYPGGTIGTDGPTGTPNLEIDPAAIDAEVEEAIRKEATSASRRFPAQVIEAQDATPADIEAGRVARHRGDDGIVFKRDSKYWTAGGDSGEDLTEVPAEEFKGWFENPDDPYGFELVHGIRVQAYAIGDDEQCVDPLREQLVDANVPHAFDLSQPDEASVEVFPKDDAELEKVMGMFAETGWDAEDPESLGESGHPTHFADADEFYNYTADEWPDGYTEDQGGGAWVAFDEDDNVVGTYDEESGLANWDDFAVESKGTGDELVFEGVRVMNQCVYKIVTDEDGDLRFRVTKIDGGKVYGYVLGTAPKREVEFDKAELEADPTLKWVVGEGFEDEVSELQAKFDAKQATMSDTDKANVKSLFATLDFHYQNGEDDEADDVLDEIRQLLGESVTESRKMTKEQLDTLWNKYADADRSCTEEFGADATPQQRAKVSRAFNEFTKACQYMGLNPSREVRDRMRPVRQERKGLRK